MRGLVTTILCLAAGGAGAQQLVIPTVGGGYYITVPPPAPAPDYSYLRDQSGATSAGQSLGSLLTGPIGPPGPQPPPFSWFRKKLVSAVVYVKCDRAVSLTKFYSNGKSESAVVDESVSADDRIILTGNSRGRMSFVDLPCATAPALAAAP